MRALAALTLALVALPAAYADEPPPDDAPTLPFLSPPGEPSVEPEEPPVPAPPKVSVIPGVVDSPLHARLRSHGPALFAGVECHEFTTSDGYLDAAAGCGLLVELVPFDFRFGDIHAAMLVGGPGPIGARAGVSFGSPFVLLGSQSSSVAFALRAHLEGVIQTLSQHDPTTLDTSYQSQFTGLGVGATFAASIAVTRLLSIEVQLDSGAYLGTSPGFTYHDCSAACTDVTSGEGFAYSTYFGALVGARL